jgi:methylmalonyl-CoA/ethylmalonyl-CoA epimerase
MNAFHLTFHHLGLAVRKPEPATRFLQGLGYTIGPVVYDPEQNVNLLMCTHPTQPAVEIVSPAEGKGPVDIYVKRQASGIVYHGCYVTDDLAQTLASFKASGIRALCVAPPKPAVLFGGRPVSFYDVLGMGLIEIIE